MSSFAPGTPKHVMDDFNNRFYGTGGGNRGGWQYGPGGGGYDPYSYPVGHNPYGGGGGFWDANVTPQTVTDVSSSAPWSVQSPYLHYGFEQARDLYNEGGPEYYPWQNYTDMAPQTELGIEQIEKGALTGNYGLNSKATKHAKKTMRGDYLHANPYLDQVFDTAANRVRRRLDSQFGGSGRYGSGMHQDIYGENMADMAGQMYNDNYQQERDRMLRMSSLAPSLAKMNYFGADALLDAGRIVKDQANEQLVADMDRWEYNQNRPYTNLADYMSHISGNYGGTKTGSTTTPLYSNSTGQNVIGGITTGLGILSNWDKISDGWDALSSLWS